MIKTRSNSQSRCDCLVRLSLNLFRLHQGRCKIHGKILRINYPKLKPKAHRENRKKLTIKSKRNQNPSRRVN